MHGVWCIFEWLASFIFVTLSVITTLVIIVFPPAPSGCHLQSALESDSNPVVLERVIKNDIETDLR
jgi:hypothetical protein